MKSAVLFIYCKRTSEYTTEALLLSLLRQLVDQADALNPAAKSFLSAKRNKKSVLQLDDIAQTFALELQGRSRVFILGDAFDECFPDKARADTLLFLRQLVKDHPSVRLLITSRPIHPIELAMDGAVKVNVIAHALDIKTYINSRISDTRTFLHALVNQAPKLREEITTTVTNRADGLSVYSKNCFVIC
jgi:hypothetical protein